MAGVGVIGCGNISGIYLRNLQSFGPTTVVAVADLDLGRARERASEAGVPKACSVEDLLADPAVEVVVNLTVPKAHADVAFSALAAGKHVYNEKPLAVGWEEAQSLAATAERLGLRLGCAPDTVLGAGIQTCRALVDQGAIGEPVAAQGSMMCAGHESWHPDPAFYYEVGGGPLFDMGPYYLSALVTLLGPVARVTGAARATFAERTVTSQPKAGERIKVETPTHLATVLEFASGAVGQLTTSFDVQAHTLPCLEVYGSEGSIQVPDPNGFGGPVRLWRKSTREWEDVPVQRPYAENSRGLGVLDLVLAEKEGRPHRASGDLALHVCEVVHAAHWAAEQSRHVDLATRPARPEPMPDQAL